MRVNLGDDENVVTHLDDHVLTCGADGQIAAQRQDGYFAADTRFVSRYCVRLDEDEPVLLCSGSPTAYGSRFEYTNPKLDNGERTIPEQTIHVRLDRSVGHGVHEDYDVVNYGSDRAEFSLDISVESDFADLFDVKAKRRVRRGELETDWNHHDRHLCTTYRRDDFERRFHLRVDRCDGRVDYANGALTFPIVLEPRETWHTCVYWLPQIGAESAPREPLRGCHQLTGADTEIDLLHRNWLDASAHFAPASASIAAIADQATQDLADLRLHIDEATSDVRASEPDDDTRDSWIPAAGVPWFVTLFGRDSTLVSLLSISLSPSFARGSLRTFGDLQATRRDDRHDAASGKIVHELRRGELAHFGQIPQTPYYGAHDAPALYVRTAAEMWKWCGDRELLDQVRPNVERALRWIDRSGDSDGDGFQEYESRAGDWGYYNQSWKDSGEAIVSADGELSGLPLALCELQGYVVAAKRAWADTIESADGKTARATRLRGEADRLCDLIDERLWWAAEGTYYLGLDGDKQPIESVASNAGHLLWCGAVPDERAASVAERLSAADMWSGWGVRTLSAEHVAYNPFSYQRGSVWPHDNAILASGLRRYGLHGFADRIAAGIFDAAELFSEHHLPELFAGIPRDEHGFPVRYLDANVPQAWAASSVIEFLAAMVGLEPDADNHALTVRPSLPEWLPELTIERLRVGTATLNLSITRGDGPANHVIDVDVTAGDLDVQIM